MERLKDYEKTIVIEALRFTAIHKYKHMASQNKKSDNEELLNTAENYLILANEIATGAKG